MPLLTFNYYSLIISIIMMTMMIIIIFVIVVVQFIVSHSVNCRCMHCLSVKNNKRFLITKKK